MELDDGPYLVRGEGKWKNVDVEWKTYDVMSQNVEMTLVF